jgi:hypothetical protein
MEGEKYYFFEYDRPPGPSGRARKPGATRHRMTIAEAKERHGDAYRPLLHTLEVRDGKTMAQFDSLEMFAPGTGPRHWGKG